MTKKRCTNLRLVTYLRSNLIPGVGRDESHDDLDDDDEWTVQSQPQTQHQPSRCLNNSSVPADVGRHRGTQPACLPQLGRHADSIGAAAERAISAYEQS